MTPSSVNCFYIINTDGGEKSFISMKKRAVMPKVGIYPHIEYRFRSSL
ncbi:hypothetical protein CHCC14821_1688 [Bacillus paralicheniformis]|nr:hypothetical protein CHCC14821_1688 [Bacillus paralicheniformis]TWM68454.1 hypothetical protein CHCC14814_0456 [Bacillus paralicheniformis]